MTSDRAQAYGRVTRTLWELGPAKLSTNEQAVIRDAADALLFSHGMRADQDAMAAFSDVCALHADLVDSGRWTAQRAGRLVDDVWACGPEASWLAAAA